MRRREKRRASEVATLHLIAAWINLIVALINLLLRVWDHR